MYHLGLLIAGFLNRINRKGVVAVPDRELDLAEAAEIQACVSRGLHRDPIRSAPRDWSPELLLGTLVKVVGVDPMDLCRRQFTPGGALITTEVLS